MPEERKRSSVEIALDQIKDPLIYILLAAGALAILLGDFVDAAVILAVVLVNGVIGFIQEGRAEAAIVELKRLLSLKAMAIRDGSEQEVDAEQLVPGDVVLLQAGRRVPADLRLAYAKELRIDQSMFTGESIPADKTQKPIPEAEPAIDEMSNIAFMGSNVASGRGRGVVVATGRRTDLGRISKEIGQAPRAKTPLEGRMQALSRLILLAVIGFGALGFAVGALRGESLVLLFLTLVALAVAAVPEGLPVAMTIALAAAVNRMARQNAVIRHLPAIETLGSCTTIGSDKTGTLTRNEMTVRRIYAGGNDYEVGGLGYAPEGHLTLDDRTVGFRENRALEWTQRTGLLCNESELVKKDGRWTAAGDPTEVALIVSARKAGLDEEAEREYHEQLDILPFESERQYMASLNTVDKNPYLLVKGSPEAVLSLSRDRLTADKPAHLERGAMTEHANRLAAEGLRVLAMACRLMPADTREITHDDVKDLTFLGMQGMLDPPRPEAVRAVRDCNESGIRVIMITGDNELTGLSVARQMGIANDKDRAMTGKDIDRLDHAGLRAAVREIPVCARVAPGHKLRIVEALIANDEIVTVTGDGVNDAPALKAAHIGVAMGITGTDVAKDASDMVVLDDNFASIYQAVVNGRVAFDNLRKVTFFLLSSGLGALLAVMVNLFTRLPLIFLPAQILWVNLVTNGLQDVALAFDPPEPGVAGRPPRPPGEGVLNRPLLIRLVIIGLTIGVISFGVFTSYIISGAVEERARTIALTTIVFAQFFNVFNSRSERNSLFRQNPLDNKFLFFSLVAALIAQLALIYLAPMRLVFRTTALNLVDWSVILLLSVLVVAAAELDKLRLRARASA